ncbi:GntR family transcriptional regulator [Spinactinospora alkalitolerans]|uniref:GntR family transcriptional regulator n=1 Tax=Spinactinospora alkalitolerans TaxID=687207 RepID=A0A852TUJ1_9ACTN|nr:GntR family transcriptional regulator [Spinactinospora alkalitolerans]NYE45590.1 GntR family transcriptional regulator [Spinactinospora alkalitolerans]
MAARHVEIAEDLLAGIENGRYPPGGHLPTEDALMVHYATSRNTVRRALERLANLGRIDTRQGSGSQVREYKPITHLASSIKGAADDERWSEYAARLREKQEGVPHQTLKVGFEAATGMIARLLDLNPSETEGFVVIRRCDRVVDGKLWERQISYYPEDIAVGTELMRPEDIKRGTITVLAELGYEQTGSWDVVGARMPSPKDSALFGLGPGVPLLVHERAAFAGIRPIRFTKTFIPADRHQLLYAEGEISPDLLKSASDVNIFDH